MRQIQPLHAIQNSLHSLRGGTFQIGILDPQDELAAMMTGIRPGIQCRTCTAQMQKTGRAWSKTSSYSHDEIGMNKRNFYFTASSSA